MKTSWNISDKNYKKLIEKTVTIPENNIRMEASLKLFGEPNKDSVVNIQTMPEILFLGGSITMGYDPDGLVLNCYPVLVIEYLKNLFNSTNIQMHNLGYSSFHSILGLSVLERIMDTFYSNISILEYGVNNSFDMEHIISFEGIVRKLLSCYPSIAIIIVSTINKEGYTCEPYMKEIASHYNLPHISVPAAINYFSDYGLTWKDYSMDMVHPHQDGHIFLSDCINYIIKKSLDTITTNTHTNSNTSNTLQVSALSTKTSACFGNTFDSIQYYDASKMPDFILGSFQPAQTHPMFPCGIVTTKKNNEPSILKVHCKKLYLLYEQSNQMSQQGQLHVTVSPTNQEYYIDSYSICTWGNPVSFKLIDGPLKNYSICFELLADDIQKDFTILGFLLVD